MAPFFSIITITRNGEQYLAQTIESVLAQDFEDYEYLIIDGGSEDDTLQIVERYAARDVRIRWHSGPDAGISDAMNKGIGIAQGTVVAHLHDDDYYLPGALGAVWQAFQQQPEAGWLVGRCRVVDGAGELLYEPSVPKSLTYRQLLRRNLVPHPAAFVRRALFSEVGLFSERLRYAMDYDLFLRLCARQTPLVLDRGVAAFRRHADSLSTAAELTAFREEYRIRLGHAGNTPWVDRLIYRIDYLKQTALMLLHVHNLRKRLLAKR